MDIAFTRVRMAIFLDGCFWHGCPQHATQPRANAEWWERKLLMNVQRDADTNQVLAAQGWTVLRFWEHEEPGAVADLVEAAVRRSASP